MASFAALEKEWDIILEKRRMLELDETVLQDQVLHDFIPGIVCHWEMRRTKGIALRRRQ